MVTDDAAEEHDRTAVRTHAPLVDRPDRQLVLGEIDPCVVLHRRMHGRIVPSDAISLRGRCPPRTARHYDQLFVERSEPDDGAWDEPLDRDSWTWGTPGEPEYPAAPLPAHERRWRHPSELGHAEWVQSEKAVGLGRGLVVTSGAIGCILGLAVVWLMVPGAGTPPTADPSVARSDVALPTTAAFALSSTTAMPVATLSTAPLATLPAATNPAALDPIVVASTSPTAPPVDTAGPVQSQAPAATTATLQLPAEDLPTNTVWLKSRRRGRECCCRSSRRGLAVHDHDGERRRRRVRPCA